MSLPLTLEYPFKDSNVGKLVSKIVEAEIEYPKTLSKPAADLLQRILNPNPKTRITLEQIIQHPWIKE